MNTAVLPEDSALRRPEAGFGDGQTIVDRIARQAMVTPEALAVRCGAEEISYAELDRRSNQLARYLQASGVTNETAVGLYVDRSVEFVVAALAIMKAGGAYLPIDSAWPPERVATVLRDAQVSVLISHRWKPAGLPPGRWSTIDLDINATEIGQLSSAPVDSSVLDFHLAYIIYTSGSTGRPKGVEITHRSLMHLIRWHISEFGVRASDRASQVAGLGFDAAVWEIWPHLAAGASLHLVDEATRRCPATLRSWLIAQQISIAFVPTSLAEELVASEWPKCNLRWLLTGGDMLRRYPLPGLPFRLVNNYGPTECTVLATSGCIRSALNSAKFPSIGRPIPGAEVHILDESLNLVPAGSPGEIYIGGAGVARGYRKDAELTAARFVRNPFGAGRLYRTGDRGRLLSDGEIAFLGRIDDQIKLRGYRIEPEEIVAALTQHPQIVRGLVVLLHDLEAGVTVVPVGQSGTETDHNGARLVAYIVPEAGAKFTVTMLREFLASRLPEYMIPTVFVAVDEIPLTSSGKFDKAALPRPSSANTIPLNLAESVSAPADPLSNELLKVIGALVGSAEIGMEDNFFLVGGHSMLAAQLLVRIRQVFGVSLTLRQLFQTPTVRALSQEIQCLLQRN